MMSDWKVSSYVDPEYGQTWVYYANPNFNGLHMSRSVDTPARDHVATDDRTSYYFGVNKTFNRNGIPQGVQTNLQNAWKDYFTV